MYGCYVDLGKCFALKRFGFDLDKSNIETEAALICDRKY
jgi:hypothetical protein